MSIHSSHKTRTSDASSFDTICDYCGATDAYNDYTYLREPCPDVPRFYYIRNYGFCGNCYRWWQEGGGYTSDLNKARKVTLEEAKKICSSRVEDTYHEVSLVDSFAQRHVTTLK